MKTNLDRIRFGVLFLLLSTGFTGLVYEVTWHRYLANFLGSHARASAIILAVFLGGLSVGYVVFGKVSRQLSAPRLVQLCGLVEIAIGVWAFLFPTLYQLAWKTIGITHTGSTAFIVDCLLAIGLIGVPTICMGGTLPLLTQALAKNLKESAQFHARVYAVNTGGAFLGCLMAGFLLIPFLGLPRTLHVMGMVNILAGCGLIVLGVYVPETLAKSENASTDADEAEELGSKWISPTRGAALAFLAGFTSICLQTNFIRLVGLSMGSSEYAFSMVVAVFICMLAVGAWVLAAEERTWITLARNQMIVFVGGFLVYRSVPYWPYASHVIRSLLTSEAPNFYVYHVLMFSLLFVVLAIPVGAMGSTMPLLFSALRTNRGELGSLVGRLYGFNTLGCVFGALCGGYLMLYVVDLDAIYRTSLGCIALSVLLSSKLTAESQIKLPYSRRFMVLATCILTILLLLKLQPWDRKRLAVGTMRLRTARIGTYEGPKVFYENFAADQRVVQYKDDPQMTVAVTERPLEGDEREAEGVDVSRALFVNGKSDGNTIATDARTTRLVAHLPALLSKGDNRKAALVGFGTGLTAAALVSHEDIDEVQCIEISPFVRKFAEDFGIATGNVGQNPKLKWHTEDAYRVLGSSKDQYRVIVSEPSNPWVTGVERLFAKEFYQIVKSRLAPGGVYAQWIQIYDISADTVGLVFRTFASEFPYIKVFQNNLDIIILGSLVPFDETSLANAEKRFQTPGVRENFAPIGYTTFENLFGREQWYGPLWFADGETHSLEFPRLSFAAGHDFYLSGGQTLSSEESRPERIPWLRATAQSSLTKMWLDRVGRTAETLSPIALKACELRKTVRFFRSWRDDTPQCQASLVALAVIGGLEPGIGLSSEDVKYLKGLYEYDPVRGAFNSKTDVTAAKRIAELYNKYESEFLPISAQALLASTKVCFESNNRGALECRVDIALALGNHGHLADAERILKAAEEKQPFDTLAVNDSLRSAWSAASEAISESSHAFRRVTQ